jgi:hypothetical protein
LISGSELMRSRRSSQVTDLNFAYFPDTPGAE